MRKSLFKRFSILLAVIFLLNTTLLYAASSRTAVIQKAEGTVQIKKSGGEKKLKAFKGMSLSEGDTIITGSDGTATLALDDDKIIKIAPNTVINIKDLKGKKGNETTTLNQSKGATVTKLGDKLLGNSSYSQKTPTAIMGIKGTVVGINQLPDGTLFSVADGKVQVSDSLGALLPLVLPGQQLTASPGVPPTLAPLDLLHTSGFTLNSFKEFAPNLPPTVAKQISDLQIAQPEIFMNPSAPKAPGTPAALLPSPTKIDFNLPAPSNGNGSSGGTGGGSGGTPPTPPTPPVYDDSVNLSAPLSYDSLMASEYISQDYSSAEKLATFLTAQGITASSASSDTLSFDLSDSATVHLNKIYTLQPSTSIGLPNELLNLDENITLQLNEFLGTTASGNNHWVQLSDPMQTKFGPNEIVDQIEKISQSSQKYGNTSFVMTPIIYIRSAVPCKITSTRINAPNYTTPTVYTISSNSGIGLPVSSFSSSAFNLSINNGNPTSIPFGDPSNPDPAAIVNAFNSAGLQATYGLDIMNASSKAKKLGIDLSLNPKNNIPLNMPSYLNSGFKASIEDVKLAPNTPQIVSDIIGELSSGRFRTLAPLKTDSIKLDSLNLLNWEYQNTPTSTSVKTKVIYSH